MPAETSPSPHTTAAKRPARHGCVPPANAAGEYGPFCVSERLLLLRIQLTQQRLVLLRVLLAQDCHPYPPPYTKSAVAIFTCRW
jgi:hypothetical protein